MKLLAIDTSTDYLSIAVMKDGKIVSRYHRKSAMRHSGMLVPMIDKLLKKARLKIEDIDCFAVGIGPGSFTGLRIAAATVKGLAYSLKKRIVAVPTLDVIADNAKKFKGIICPVLDARKNKVYACLYRSDGSSVKKISRYLLLPAAGLLNRLKKYGRVFLLGDAVSLIMPRGCRGRFRRGADAGGDAVGWYPRAEVAARIGSEAFRRKKFVRPEDLEPMYLYSEECDITGK
jgi:tRNA threonylcarbamoyladenosine biosynthesis protein TsaB